MIGVACDGGGGGRRGLLKHRLSAYVKYSLSYCIVLILCMSQCFLFVTLCVPVPARLSCRPVVPCNLSLSSILRVFVFFDLEVIVSVAMWPL